MSWSVFILAAYVVGGIPFGVFIGKARGLDIRTQGSRNIGASNVTRLLGRPLGLLCFGLDVAKGAGPVLFAGFYHGLINRPVAELQATDQWLWLAVAIASVAGHMFSIFLGFRGGKGVATGFGSLAAMWSLLTLPTLGAMVIWYFMLRMTKYIAVASMTAVLSLPLLYLLSVYPNDGKNVVDTMIHAAPPFIVTGTLALLIVFQHRSNIGRLRRGEEPKVGGRGRRGDVLDESHATEK